MNRDLNKRSNNRNFNLNSDLIEFFNVSPDMVFIHDNYGNLIEANENLRTILGVKNKERDAGILFRKKMILDEKKTDKSIYSKFFRKLTKRPINLEYKLETKKGKILYVEGYSIPIYNNDLNSPLYIHIAHDVSGKKQVQKELMAAQKEIKSISTMIPEVRLWSLSQKKNSINLIKKSGQVLKESEEKYRTILENIQEGYFEIDLNGNLFFF